jgi:hypothetical protein
MRAHLQPELIVLDVGQHATAFLVCPSSRGAGLVQVEAQTVPPANLLKLLAGATGLEPATSGVTGRAKVEQYQRISNFCRSKNVP